MVSFFCLSIKSNVIKTSDFQDLKYSFTDHLILYFSLNFYHAENTDPSLFEADIKLMSEQRFALETTGDIDARVGVKRGITNDQGRLWPGGIVPYNITEDLRKC
jgi:hypothetical protein